MRPAEFQKILCPRYLGVRTAAVDNVIYSSLKVLMRNEENDLAIIRYGQNVPQRRYNVKKGE